MEPSMQDVYQELIRLNGEVSETNALLRESIVKVDYCEAAVEEHGKQIRHLNDMMSYVKGAAGISTLGVAWVWAKVTGIKLW